MSRVILYRQQVSIVALAWAGDGKFLNIGEKVVLPILLAYALVTMAIGLIAVSVADICAYVYMAT